MPTPGIVQYPGALDDVVSLIEAANAVSETLTAAISASDLLIPVSNIAAFSDSGVATILDHPTAPTQRENIVYVAKSGGSLVVPAGGRGRQGTAAQAFSSGAVVSQRPTALHHETLAAAILALQAKLGAGASTPTEGQVLRSVAAGMSAWEAINAILTDVTTLQTVISNLRLLKAAPALELVDTAPDPDDSAVIDVTGGNLRLTPNLLIALATGVVTFGQIPVGPASNPTTDNQLTRKAYVDSRRTLWSASFAIADPSTHPLFPALTQLALVPSSSIVATHIGAVWTGGSASGSFSIEIWKMPFNANPANRIILGAITFNPGTAGVGVEVDIGDHTFTANDWIAAELISRSNPGQRNVSIYVKGYQTLT